MKTEHAEKITISLPPRHLRFIDKRIAAKGFGTRSGEIQGIIHDAEVREKRHSAPAK